MKRIISVMSTKVKVSFVLLLVLSAAASYAASYWPVLFAGLVDGISSGEIGAIDDLVTPLAAFAGFCCTAKLFSILLRVGGDVSAASFEADMQEEGFFSALSLPSSSKSLGRQSAELGSIIAQGVEGCSQLYKLLVKDAIPVVLTTCFIGYQVAVGASPIMLCIVAAYIVLSFGVSFLQIRSQNGIRDEIIQRHARLNGDVAQSISHHEAIRAMAAERFEAGRLASQIRGIAQRESTHHSAMGRYDAVKQILEVALFAGVAVAGVILMSGGSLTAGALVGTLMLCQQLIVPIDSIYRLLDEIATSRNKVSRLMEIVREADSYADDDRALECAQRVFMATDGAPAVTARGVSALTQQGIPINEGVGFRADNGDVLRFDGPTGCGKSSLVKALFGYNEHEGSLCLFGREVSEYSRRQLAEIMFYLPQDSFVFSGTVRENLIYGFEAGTFSDAELVEALEKAMFSPDEVTDWAAFLNRDLPENGKDLSGGQRQRLQAARLFLRHPRILLADEPTASLDIPTAKALMGNMIEHVTADDGTVCFVSHQEPVQTLATSSVRVGKRAGRPASPTAGDDPLRRAA